MELKYKKLISEAQAPTKSYESDAGWDFYCTSYDVKEKYIEYHTGIALEIPDNMVGLAFPRSSITNKDLMLKNSVGVIDAGYRNEIIFRFIQMNETYNMYEIGDRIGQLIFIPIPQITLVEAEELSASPRNMGGFGSTDNVEVIKNEKVLNTDTENDNIVRVRIDENGKLTTINDFQFTIESPIVYHYLTWLPMQKLSFIFSPEMPNVENNDELFELVGEKLKQDFIKRLNT